ncbi:MAG: MBL fold metallo-hydrolase [bacterium]
MFKKKFHFLILVILFSSTFFVWSVVFEHTSDNLLEVYFFDVGQGDSIFIETPSNKQILIDGGPDKMVLEKLNQTMPLYDRTIDLVILTHPDADHITGLIDVIDYYSIGQILTSGFELDTAVYKEWQDLIKLKNIPVTIVQAGQKIILEKDVIIEILWPDQSLVKNANNSSVVGRLVYGDSEFLLTGDIEKEVESRLIEQGWNLDSDVLKVGHHGSKTSNSFNFIKAVNPKISVISVGEDNKYGHPNNEILEILKNSVIYRTDKDGDIEISADYKGVP